MAMSPRAPALPSARPVARVLSGLLLGAGLVAIVALIPAARAQGARYVELPAGRFESVLPQGATPLSSVPVDIDAFWLRETPVTAGEFAAFARDHPEWARDRVAPIFADASYLAGWPAPLDPGPGANRRPAVQVSWFAARAYCASEGARLPTWIEWEYAAAASASRRDARADPAWRQSILSWYERTAADPPAPVGGPANVYGVRDLHGVVWEWVDDFNALFIAGDSRTQGDPDTLKFCGAGAISVLDRESYAVLMRIALLSSLAGRDTTTSLGFRCARSRDAEPR
jgi:formylglycine-generating enzyme required for sulfatase activity